MSDMWAISTGQPVYSKFTVAKAVSDGYKINPTVYRAIYLITKAASSVPWMVYNEDNEPIPEHNLSKMFKFPNPHISRQDLFELVFSWLELAGNAYLKKVKTGSSTKELWPISPDRMGVVPSKDIEEWMLGYSLDSSTRVDFQPEEIVHLMFFNPANPLLGISPLEAVSKTVDTDGDQQDWNKSAMQNRGVLDGILALDREFVNQEDADLMSEKINESFTGPRNARRIKVLGSNAKYFAIAATPVEMDFANSRKENRNEIFTTFGVPPQYAGAQESSTYNNYQTSELIFWTGTILPLLDDVADAFTFNFRDELTETESIGYDRSRIQSMRRALEERVKVAKVMFTMGVPYAEINRIFQFGVEEFEGWDKSYVTMGQEGATPKAADETPAEAPVRGIDNLVSLKKKYSL